jgi:peroxiredoxin
LRRWEELRPELDARGVQIVTLCTDKPEQIRTGKRKHGLRAIMLSDREATAIDQLGIRNQGFHSGIPGGASALPIPTTVLVDAGGVVRWIDQSENYQRRSDPDRVLGALREHLA